MRLRALAIMTMTTASLVACGLDTNQQDDFEDKSKTKRAENERDADAQGSKGSKENLDCDGITLHGTHLTCDDDDVAARDQNNSGSNGGGKKDDSTDSTDEGDAPGAGEPDSPANNGNNGTPADPETPDSDPNIVVFRIKAGTGNGGWNTQAEMIEAKVGQVIRVYNDDTIVHRLHTSGRPCPHGVNIPVGGSRDCVVGQTFDSTSSNAVYDHIAGPSSKIWIRATN